jgi:hypothetical protein
MSARRTWRSRVLGLGGWIVVAILTAIVLVIVTERYLPSNF